MTVGTFHWCHVFIFLWAGEHGSVTCRHLLVNFYQIWFGFCYYLQHLLLQGSLGGAMSGGYWPHLCAAIVQWLHICHTVIRYQLSYVGIPNKWSASFQTII